MVYYSLEGLLASGKSSILKYLAEYFTCSECTTIREPVEDFRDYKDKMYNPIQEMQDDPKRNAFTGQLHILQQSVAHYAQECENSNAPIIISDQSVCSPFAFIDCLHKNGYLSKFTKDYMLGLWSEGSKDVCKSDFFIFIDVSPARCHHQLKEDKSHDLDEHKLWSKELLSVLMESHEKMFNMLGIPVKKIQVDEDMLASDVAVHVISLLEQEAV